MTRLTEDDRKLGPLTWGRSSWSPWRMVLSSGGGDDNYARNSLTVYAFGWVVRLCLPTILQPWRRWVDTSQYALAKGPGSGYWEVKPREFGFSLNEGFLQLFLGPQTNDSTTTRSWCCHLPWTQWRHVRLSLFDVEGTHYWTEWSRPRGFKLRDQWGAVQAVKDACPKVAFEIEDHDGQRVIATTCIEEHEWRFGEKWCRWLSFFRKPMVRRSLDIRFATEVGTEKGSWKGGLIGTSIQMLPGELHESAFRRYCEQEHRAKHGRYRVKFIGLVL
jgi:hypothetical protein